MSRSVTARIQAERRLGRAHLAHCEEKESFDRGVLSNGDPGWEAAKQRVMDAEDELHIACDELRMMGPP